MNIRLIGYGRLAKSLVPHWAKKHSLAISSPSLTEEILPPSIKTHASNLWALEGQDIIILCVKPQLMASVLTEISSNLEANTLIVSLAAGLTLTQLQTYLPNNCHITRAMPNIAAEVAASFTLLRHHDGLSPKECSLIETLFSLNGPIHWVEDDKLLDLGTIIAGSGPAYVYFFMRAFQQAAIDLGCPEDLAKAMVMQTFMGATTLAQHKGLPLQELQAQVTSPKGTTAAAIRIFEDQGVDKTIIAAIENAWARVLSIRTESKI